MTAAYCVRSEMRISDIKINMVLFVWFYVQYGFIKTAFWYNVRLYMYKWN